MSMKIPDPMARSDLLGDFVAGAAANVIIYAILITVVMRINPPSDAPRPSGPVSRTRHLRAAALPINMTITFPFLLLYFGPPSVIDFLVTPDYHPPAVRLLLLSCFVATGSIGLLLLLWTNVLFHRAHGTLGPWDPPETLILEGPYRHVRNPMLAGVILVILAEGLLTGRVVILGFGAAFVAVNTVYFVKKEEPELADRFGEEYRAYLVAVPRWIPSIGAYYACGEGEKHA